MAEATPVAGAEAPSIVNDQSNLGVSDDDVSKMAAALAASGDPLFAEPEPAPQPAPQEAQQPESQATELTADDLPESPAAADGQQAVDAFEIVHNGQQVKLSRADTIKYAQQGFDYRRKTEAVAEDSRQVKAALARAQEVEQAQNVLGQELGQLTALGAQLSQYQNVDWVQYATTNPQDYPVQRARFDELNRAYNQVLQSAQAKHGQIEQARDQMVQQTLAQEASKLPQYIPEWSDPQKHEAGRRDMANYLLKTGYSAEEIRDGLVQAKTAGIVWKAMQYDRLLDQKRAGTKQVRTPPPQTRPSASQPEGRPGADQEKQMMGRLRQSGSLEDAAAILANRWN